MDSCGEDLISNLPDEILGKILSLAPTKVAASTSVLSKRWRNLLCLIDSLCFDESAVVYPNEEEAASGSHRFLDFVENTFALLLSKSQVIKKLSLSRVHEYGLGHGVEINYLFTRASSCFTRWITTSLGRGLLELHLHAARFAGVELETNLLTSNTLVKLTISCEFFIEFKRVFLPALKSLSLLSVSGLDHPNYCRLLDGCPLLEDLYIRDGDYHRVPPGCSLCVQSASIKRLVVYTGITIPCLRDRYGYYELVCFEAPSLVYLDYSSYVAENYEFIHDLDLLVEVRLSLMLWDSMTDYDEPKTPIFGNVTNLVLGIRNITTLHLSPESLETFHFCCKSMSVFSNLLNLSIESDKEKGWQVMPLLLKSCPYLETLLIKGLIHRVTSGCGDACPCISKKQKNERQNKKRKIVVKEEEILCCLGTCHVKVLEISEYGGSFQELRQMRHFLGKLKCLETVKVGFYSDNNNREFLWANLLALPRVSEKCNLQFI